MGILCALAILAAVVQPLPSAPQLLIPAAGSTPGANGTFFHSDIAIANFANHTQLVRLQWLPQGATSTFSTTITLQALDFVHSADFVAEVLGQSGLGAIVLTGVTSSGNLDPTASLWAQSQIWSPQPGSGGTTSQSFPAIPISAINTQDAIIPFPAPRRTGSFRTNLGIVNLDPVNAQTIAVAFPAPIPVGVTVTVPPMGMQLFVLGGPSFTALPISNVTPASTRSNAWIAWGSTVDNITGDAWSEIAVAGAPLINWPALIGK